MIKLFSLPIAELECDNEILNGKLGKTIEYNLRTSGDARVVYDALSYVALKRNAEVHIRRDWEDFIEIEKNELDSLYTLCQKEKHSVYCGWMFEGVYYGISIDWDRPFVINGYTDEGNLNYLSTMLLQDFKTYFVRLAYKSFVEVERMKYDKAIIKDVDRVYYGFGWLEMLKNKDSRQPLIKLAKIEDKPDRFLEDSYIEKSLDNMGKLAKSLNMFIIK